MPFKVIDQACIEFNAPISDRLFGEIKEDLDYLKAVVSDGASAPQDIVGKNITASGNLSATGDLTVDGGNFFGANPIAFSGSASVVFKSEVSVAGFGVNASGKQFAPDTGVFDWGLFAALTLATSLLRYNRGLRG